MGRHRKTVNNNPTKRLFGAAALGSIAAGLFTGDTGELPRYEDPPSFHTADVHTTDIPLTTTTTPTTQPTTTTPQPTTTKAVQKSTPKPVSGILDIAKSWLGKRIPYVYGGATLRGMDCSHFVWEVLKQAGYKVPYRTSWTLRTWVTMIPESQARPGDLVFWYGHVGFYAGNGMVIDHGSGLGPKLRPIWRSASGPLFGRLPQI